MAQVLALPKANYLSNGKSMKVEKYRIASFSNWKAKKELVRPLSLAKNGFFVNSQMNIVCYFCKSKIDYDEEDEEILSSLRYIHNTECPMRPSAAGGESASPQNVPFKPGMASTSILDRVRLSRLSGDQHGAVGGKPMIVSDGHMAAKHSRDINGSQSTNTKDASSDELTSEIIKTRRKNPGEAFLKLMRSEANRIKTFFDFPLSSGVPGDLLAAAGFFFMGDADRTQCAFCRGVLRNWDPGDDPKSEHKRHFTKCPLMNGQECENEPLPQSVADSPSHRAKNPLYSTEVQRQKSFWNWPSQKTQKPDVMASAGFYFTGSQDHVKCFCCDGGLRIWEEGDDPWEEHARWFPRCDFIRKARGEGFIQQVTHKYEQASPSSQRSSTPSASYPVNSVVRRDLNARMDSPIVKLVLSMGFDRQDVVTTIEQRLKATGDDFDSGQSLVEAILSLKDRREEKKKPGNADITTSKSKKKKNKKKQKKQAAVAAAVSEPAVSEPAKPAANTEPIRSNSAATEDNASEFQLLARQNAEMKEARVCKVCMDEEVNTVFLPCGHLVCCSSCAPALRDCPLCRALIKGTVRVFLS